MSDDYPFGADCDTDAIRAAWDWTPPPWTIASLVSPISEQTLTYNRASRPAVWRGGKAADYLDSSPQCRGDGATEPGGGAPTSKETQ